MSKTNKIIKSKSDLLSFLDAVDVSALSAAAKPHFRTMVDLSAGIADVHGRSTQAREAVAAAEKARKQLTGADIPNEQKAPKKAKKTTKKKGAKKAPKATLTDEEKAERKAARDEQTRIRRGEKNGRALRYRARHQSPGGMSVRLRR